MKSEQTDRIMSGPQKPIEPASDHQNFKETGSEGFLGEIASKKRNQQECPAQTSSNSGQDVITELRKKYPSKIVENCQRTVRVILISELQNFTNFNLKAKAELHEILGEFVNTKRNPYSDDEFSRNNKVIYYNTLNYSRVKIGQKNFEKKILTNTYFQSCFIEIFRKQDLYKSQKPRKNQRSQVSFEERRKIISEIIQLNFKKFSKSLNSNKITEESSHNQEESLLVAVEQKIQPQPAQFLPIIPIAIYKNRMSIDKEHKNSK